MTSLPIPSGESVRGAVLAAMATPTAEKEQFLLQAFGSFAEAANSLERSYSLLRAEVMRLTKELEESNSGLVRSLEENRRMRQHLTRVVAGLPCGILVVVNGGEISDLNPEGRRLLGISDTGSSGTGCESISSFSCLRGELRELLERARGEDGELEQRICDGSGPAFWLAARCAAVPDSTPGSSVFILRDVSERKRLEEAQGEFRREQAMAEMSTVLAHEVRTNLNAASAVGDSFPATITVYDSLGASHTLTATFTNKAANLWTYSLAIPASDLLPVGGVPQTGVLATGTLTFNGNGVLTATTPPTVGTPGYTGTGNGTMSAVAGGATSVAETITMTATDATHFTVSGSVSGVLGTATAGTAFTSGQIGFTIAAGSTAFVAGDKFTVATAPGTLAKIPAIPITNFADGASNQTFTWNVFNGTTPVISQVAAPSSTSSTQQDGSSGSLVKFTIGSDGTITGSFSNGKTQALGQLALATFANNQGLQLLGNTDFSPTLASGQAVVGAPGGGGRGTLSGGALELSNVDIATEFANLIVAQRGFEADAKAVTTFDEITRDTIALKQ
jgi:flagellar hook-basal body protein